MPDPGVRNLPQSMRSAFEEQFGRVTKMSYKGKDKFGNSVYEFLYLLPGQTKAAGPFARSSYPHRKTVAVGQTDDGWRFGAPDSKAFTTPIAGADDVAFRGDTRRSNLVDRAIAKVGELETRGLINSEQAKTLINGFGSWNDSALTRWISRAGTGNRPGFGSVTEVEPEEEAFPADFWGPIGGGGGGGGGFAGPVYRAPDRRVVEDYVKGTLASLVGTIPDHLVGPAVEKFMADHRRNFDSETQEIDPQASVEELIRGTQEYQRIHKLRPKSEDERQWISQRAAEAQRGGLDTAQIEDFAITQATAGGDLPDIAGAAATAQFKRSGQAPTLLDNQFRQVAQAMFAGVRR